MTILGVLRLAGASRQIFGCATQDRRLQRIRRASLSVSLIALAATLTAQRDAQAQVTVTGAVTITGPIGVRGGYIISNTGNLTIRTGANVTALTLIGGAPPSSGVQLAAPGSRFTMQSGTFVTGTNATGDFTTVLANGGIATIGVGGGLNDVQLLASGANAAAVRAHNTGTQVNLNGATLRSTGNNTQRFTNSSVVYAADGSVVNITNSFVFSSITPAGPNAGFDGVTADTGGSITLTNTAIEVGHSGVGVGIVANDGSSVTVQGGTVSMLGTGSPQTGMLSDFESTIEATDVAITVASPLGRGIEVFSGPEAFGFLPSSVTGTNLTVTATGDDSIGLVVGGNALLQLTGSAVTVSGANSLGATVGGNSNSRLELLDGTTVVAQRGIAALGDQDLGITSAFDVVIDHSTVTATTGDALFADNTQGTFTVRNGSILTPGNGILLEAINSIPDATFDRRTDVTLILDGVQATGDIVTDLFERGPAFGSIANVTLANQASLTGAMHYASAVDIDGTSSWEMTRSSNVVTLTNAGLVDFLPIGGGLFSTLTTTDYIGSGGSIGLNTFLGTDGSPSDRLVIDGGTATGNSFLLITNAGGAGALTIGNGILVVDAINGAVTDVAAFSLGAPAVAGPYEYSLFRGATDGTSTDSWYLRSVLDCTLDPDAPVCQQPEPPDFRTEVSLYAAIPSLALQYGRTLLGTLHERVGEEEDIRGRKDLHQFAPDTGGWGRIFGTHGEHEGDPDGIFGDGPDYSYDFYGMQVGQDIYRGEDDQGRRDHAGIYAALGGADGRVDHFDGSDGDSDFTALSFAGYWTHFGASGWYLDGVTQGTWYDVNSSAHRGIQSLDTDGWGFAASLEGGYPVPMDNGYFIEPQAQLIYQTIDIDDASDGAADVRFEDVDSLTGRIGARIGRSWTHDEDGSPRLVTVWLRPNLWHEFEGNPKTEFSSADGFIPFRSDIGGTSIEINGGLSDQIDENTSLYANASYEEGLGNTSNSYSAKLGFRLNW